MASIVDRRMLIMHPGDRNYREFKRQWEAAVRRNDVLIRRLINAEKRNDRLSIATLETRIEARWEV